MPGDERGWFKKPGLFQEPDAKRKESARRLMTEPTLTLDAGQRAVAERTVADHCRFRGWHLHAVNCRTQHVHVMALAMPSADEKRKANQLVFHKYGDQYFLSEIRSQESAINLQLATSKQEKRAREETEQAGLRVHDEVMIALN